MINVFLCVKCSFLVVVSSPISLLGTIIIPSSKERTRESDGTNAAVGRKELRQDPGSGVRDGVSWGGGKAMDC